MATPHADTMNLCLRPRYFEHHPHDQEIVMLKLIAKSLVAAAHKLEAVDTQAAKDTAAKRAGQVVTVAAKGVLATTNVIGGFAERYADPEARKQRQIAEARALLAKLEA